MRKLQGHRGPVNSVAWSPDGKWLASGSDDATVQTWEADTGKLVRELQGHRGPVNSVAWSPDGKWLASGSDDATVQTWTSFERTQVCSEYTHSLLADISTEASWAGYPCFSAHEFLAMPERAYRASGELIRDKPTRSL